MLVKLVPNRVLIRGFSDLFVRQLEFELCGPLRWGKNIFPHSMLEAKSSTIGRCFECRRSYFTQFDARTVPPQSSTHFLEILVQAQQGDPSALSEMTRIFMPQLEIFCRRIVSDRDIAQDVAQETWIKVKKRFSTQEFTSEGKFRSWVCKIARNVFLDSIRRKKALDGGDDFDPPEKDNGSILDELIRDEDCERLKLRLKECIERLSVVRRKVLVLRYFEYLEYEEIANQINIPKGTVSSTINRTHAKLHACMESKST